MSMAKNYILSALLAGTALALVSAIPGISVLNCCCCAWVVLGGFLAAYLFRSDNASVSPFQGLLVGAMAGFWGSFVYSVLSSIITAIQGKWSELTLDALDNFDVEIPREMLELMSNIFSNPFFAFSLTWATSMVTYTLAAAFGGLVAGAILPPKGK